MVVKFHSFLLHKRVNLYESSEWRVLYLRDEDAITRSEELSYIIVFQGLERKCRIRMSEIARRDLKPSVWRNEIRIRPNQGHAEGGNILVSSKSIR